MVDNRSHILFKPAYIGTVGKRDNWIVSIAIMTDTSLRAGELEVDLMIESGALQIVNEKDYKLTEKGVHQ